MDKKKSAVFLSKLQAEAAFQQKLSEHRLLPVQVDGITAFIGTHAWQTVLFLALFTAMVLEFLEKI